MAYLSHLQPLFSFTSDENGIVAHLQFNVNCF